LKTNIFKAFLRNVPGDIGKLVFYPGNGLEHAGDATNPVEAVCGLHLITVALLALPELSAES
jgi:hypothetical protein